MSARRRVERRLLEPGRLWRRPRGQTRAALKSVRAIPNPRPEARRPKEIRRPRSELIATPAEQQPIELGHSRNSELPPITQMGADNKAGSQAGRLRHGLFPICEYLRQLRLRNSDFGLLSGFGLRSSDFRAAEHDLPSTGRTLEPPCRQTPRRVRPGRRGSFTAASPPARRNWRRWATRWHDVSATRKNSPPQTGGGSRECAIPAPSAIGRSQ